MIPTSTRDVVLTHLLRDGAMHRADLARVMGVSRTTIGNAVAPLVVAGVLEAEPGSIPAGVGQHAPKKQRLVIAPKVGLLASLVFRRTGITVGLASLDATMLGYRFVPKGVAEPGASRMEQGLAMLSELRGELGLSGVPIHRGQVAVNSQVDSTSGEIHGGKASWMWTGTNPKTVVEQELGAPVRLENSARLLGFVEYLAHPEARNLIYAHLTGGVAMGQVINGEIAGGSHGGAGELGHLSIDHDGRPCECGNRGCLGRYVGMETVMEEVRAVLGPSATLGEAVDAAKAGHHAATLIFRQTGRLVGEALASVCNLLDPDLIVLGGSVVAAGELYAEPVRATILERALPLVTRSLNVVLGSATADQAAITRASFELLRRETSYVEGALARINSFV
ncbi:MAG: ROK family transcriptional regulator [Propionibacteriaceae bacterium]|nr:ROK family transcriptional regulator [Propionibacteriaceae bacterium]